jgi:tight adherence protein C
MLILGLVAVAGAIALGAFVIIDSLAKKPEPLVSAETVVPSVQTPKSLRPVEKEELPSLYKRLGEVAVRLTPVNYGKNLRQKLDKAGNPPAWTRERVLAYKGLGLFFGAALGFLYAQDQGFLLGLIVVVGVATFGFFLPDIWVTNLGQRRHQELVLGLPDAVDMMTVCVEAGLGFDAALVRVARNMEGPIAEEFARVLQEMQFGKSRSDALRAMADRTQVSEVQIFASSMVQAGELGISIGDVLREQAREMRIRRRQRAEEQAHKLPVKILGPLMTCMLPAMFIVIIGPAMIQIAKNFAGFGGK